MHEKSRDTKRKSSTGGSEKGAGILHATFQPVSHGLLPRSPRVVAKKCTLVGFILLCGSLLRSWKM